MPNANGRSQKVKDLLRLRSHPMTVREICAALGLPMTDAKFVSSILVGYAAKNEVTVLDGYVCSVTNRKLNAYRWGAPAGSAAPQRPRPAPGATGPQSPRARRQGRPTARPTPPPAPPPRQPKLDPSQAARAAARRAAAEAAAKARQNQQAASQAADRKTRAFLVFERLTGCRSRDPQEMKAAYRKACLKHHPDRGGDHNVTAELNSAWTEIGA